jgi:type IV pilus assembly protein PilV
MNRTIPRLPRRAAGFSLIELMVALVVFTVGLLGLGLLISSSVRSNHVGMLHTHATFVAEALVDRMRANLPGLWTNAYNGTFTGGGPGPGSACTGGSACGPAALAVRDTNAWSQMMGQLLPNSNATVRCVTRGGAVPPTATEIFSSPVYDGTCTITLSWSEVGESVDGAVVETYQMVVQP